MVYRQRGSFPVNYLQVLDENGRCDEKLLPQLGAEDLKRMYELMFRARLFDETALKLQREGRIGTYASIRGQEAAQVGSAYAMQKDDWAFPSFREHGVYIARGLPMELILAYWGGDERGNKIPEGVNVFTVSIPVSTQIPHAVGFAWGMKLRGENSAVIAYFGDGATSKGDFHEALNFAGVFKLPVVFMCQNNQYAISLPLKRQTAAQTIAQKAIAYGFEGVQVDGNDVLGVYRATRYALDKTRNGGGPTLIECVTYRIEHHTTADDSGRYRSKEEVDAWKAKDPVDRLRKYLRDKGMMTSEEEAKLLQMLQAQVAAAVEAYEQMPKPKPDDMFTYTYAALTPQLKEQMESSRK
ncbi:MAG: pyruvate dehydrogenase (acetyl-transferring) E1 component subunit alpha [Candidatus Aenigmarchaeota archaeon]|nr:pyruvate dehydrogenase (acetyl-transferring) E1 component subunit alpha [Candidatus Aenigmarchaeota archaeon]